MNPLQPSDKLIKKIFSRKQEAIDFFTEYLPPGLMENLDLENMISGKENFVGLEWDESRTDQLYQIPLKSGSLVYIYLLFEHKSYYDPKVFLQLLEYLSKIYRWQFDHHKKLQIILPFVFYHGEEKWDLGLSFAEMFDLEKNPKEFQSYIPNFQIQLFELSSSGEEFHSENNALYIFIRLIQMIRAEPERFEKELIHLFTILSKEKDSSKRIEIFFDMVKYIFSVRKDAKRFNRKEIYKPLEAEYMTYLEELEAEYEMRGLEKGIQKGIQKGKLETARNLQAEGFELSLIKKITGLTEEEIKGAGI
jgi:predicted transposase/invertase (TIGR01784 family)